MEDLSLYFAPLEEVPEPIPDLLGNRIKPHTEEKGFPDFDRSTQLALLGVEERRPEETGNGRKGTGLKEVRRSLYRLSDHFPGLGIVDLGDIRPGHEPKDSDHALTRTVATALRNEVVPVVIGGSHDLTFAHFKGYQELERTINMGMVDPRIDLGDPEGPFYERSFLGHLFAHRPNFLFNYVQIGFQRHFVPPELMEVMEKMNFDLFGLGEVQKGVEEMEPALRDLDFLSFDLSALKHGEFPAAEGGGPNGLYGEEACQLLRYAGMNDKLSSLGLYGYLPEEDPNGMSGAMLAQLLWYFLEGYASRKKDLPILDRKDLVKYTVDLETSGHSLNFYKSKKSDRWWLEVPYPPDPVFEHQRSRLTPCSYQDYLTALEDEIPDLWWRTYRKLA